MASFIVTTVIPDVLTGTVFPLSHGHAPLHVPHGGGAIDAFKFSTIFGRLNAGSLLQHLQVSTPQQPHELLLITVLEVTTVCVGTFCTISFPRNNVLDVAVPIKRTTTNKFKRNPILSFYLIERYSNSSSYLICIYVCLLVALHLPTTNCFFLYE